MTPVKMVKSALNNNVKLKAKRLPIKSAENPQNSAPTSKPAANISFETGYL